jgi:DNA repair protein RadC
MTRSSSRQAARRKHVGEVQEQPGSAVCRIAVYSVRLKRERYLAFPWREFGGAADAVALFRKYVGQPDREHMVAIHLDARNRVSGIHTVSIGGLQQSEAGAREVFKAAILASAAAIVLVHNHPSGDPAPSPDDVAVAQGLELAGQLLAIPVVDLVIVGDPGHTSLRELDLLEFDAGNPDPLGARNTDEGWVAGLEPLRLGAALLSGGMAAVRREGRREHRSADSRGFLPVPMRRALFEPVITVEPDPSLRPRDLEPLLEDLQRRIGAALERAVDGVAATVRVDDVGLSFAAETPVFPMAADTVVLQDSTAIVEEVEALGAELGLGGVLHDATGRAFRCNLDVRFARLAGMDQRVEQVFTLDDSDADPAPSLGCGKAHA